MQQLWIATSVPVAMLSIMTMLGVVFYEFWMIVGIFLLAALLVIVVGRCYRKAEWTRF